MGRGSSVVARARPRKVARPPFVRGLDDTRALLVAAARDVFLESGPANFSLREVARRVGVSAAAVYRHFDGKEALVFAACTQGFQVFASYLVRALVETTPLARLLATGDNYRAFALENQRDYRFIFMSPVDEVESDASSKLAASGKSALPQDTTFWFLVDRVKECIAAGVLAPGVPEHVAVQIWAHVHGIVSLRLSGRLTDLGDDEAFSAFYRSSVAGLLGGLAP